MVGRRKIGNDSSLLHIVCLSHKKATLHITDAISVTQSIHDSLSLGSARRDSVYDLFFLPSLFSSSNEKSLRLLHLCPVCNGNQNILMALNMAVLAFWFPQISFSVHQFYEISRSQYMVRSANVYSLSRAATTKRKLD